MYPVGPMRMHPVQQFEHYCDVWLEGSERLLRVSRDAMGSADASRLAETLWRLGNPTGAAFCALRRTGASKMNDVVLDWSHEKNGDGKVVHSLWACYLGEQWDTMIRMAWHSEPRKEKECSSPDGSASLASAETSDSASVSASS